MERNEAWTGDEPAFDEVRLYPDRRPPGRRDRFRGRRHRLHPAECRLDRALSRQPARQHDGRGVSGPVLCLGRHEHGPPQAAGQARAPGGAVRHQRAADHRGGLFRRRARSPPASSRPGLPGHREETLVPMAGDPAKARELLAEAGAEGIELRLAVRNTATCPPSARSSRPISRMSASPATSTCSIRACSGPSAWRPRATSGRMSSSSSTASPPRPTPTTRRSGSSPTRSASGTGSGSDPRFDELHQAAVRETDPRERGHVSRDAGHHGGIGRLPLHHP
jgi:hypothetical protein